MRILQYEEHGSPAVGRTWEPCKWTHIKPYICGGPLHIVTEGQTWERSGTKFKTSPRHMACRRRHSSEDGWKFHVLSGSSGSTSFIVQVEREATWHAYLTGYGLLELKYGNALPYLFCYQYRQGTKIKEHYKCHKAAQN
jgi:hypothetical protein